MFQDGGSIILNASIGSSKGVEGLSVYGATKAAIRSFATFLDHGIEGPQDPSQRSQSWSDNHTVPVWLTGGTGRAVQEERRKQRATG